MKTTIQSLVMTLRWTTLMLALLPVLSTTALALTMEFKVDAAYVREHPNEFSVKVSKGQDGLIHFTLTHSVPKRMYHVAHLAV